ncbi:unnamed protein product [Schistosoma turkestanicum]|nr:unnamed protein product [Schistosoma turkestanicum]
MRFEKTNNVEIVVKDLDSLHHSCKQFEIAIVEMQGRKNIHNMLVISLLYNMRYTLNEHFGEFYPVNNRKYHTKLQRCERLSIFRPEQSNVVKLVKHKETQYF